MEEGEEGVETNFGSQGCITTSGLKPKKQICLISVFVILKEAMKKSAEESKRLKSDHPQPEAGASSANDPNVILPSDKFTEQNVKTLMAYGFPREKCIEELRANNGDEKSATAALFAKSLKF